MTLPRYRFMNGFTLLELLVALALFALLAAVAFPSFARVVEANRVISATNEFKTALNYARSEAVRRNQSVTLAPLAGNWQAGWEARDSSGQALRRWPLSTEGLIPDAPSTIRFSSLGRLAPGTSLQPVEISLRMQNQGRCIRLEPSGLARVLTPPGPCTQPTR